MAAPPTPSTLDGLPLSEAHQRKLKRLIQTIWLGRRERDPKAIVTHAQNVLRRMLRQGQEGWEDAPFVQLQGSSGVQLRQRR